jgi:hypothetical protein
MTKLQIYLILIGGAIVALVGGAWWVHHAGYASGYADAIASVKNKPSIKLMQPPAVIDTGEITARRIDSGAGAGKAATPTLTPAQGGQAIPSPFARPRRGTARGASIARNDSTLAQFTQFTRLGRGLGRDVTTQLLNYTLQAYHVDTTFSHHYETPIDTTVTDSLSFDFVLAPVSAVRNFRFVPAPVPVRFDTVLIVQTVSGAVSFGEAAKYVLVGIGVGAIMEGLVRK